MPFVDLREFLGVLDRESELLTIEQPVSPRYEWCALLAELERRNGPAAHATSVPGYDASLAAGTLGSRRRLALGIDTTPDGIGDAYLQRKAELIPPKIVDGGPCQEVVVDRDVDVLQALPVPTYHERDASPYFTAAVATARSPISGFQSTGIHRVQVKGPDRLGINLATPPLTTFLHEAEERGETLPIALCVGLDPGMLFSSVVWVPGADRFAIGGAMRGAPVELTKAVASDLNVPATAEVVIEGEILPGVREEEGPFGETTGYYFVNQNAIIRVKTITHRRSPVLYALHPKSTEVFNLLGIAREAEIREYLRSYGARVSQVHITPESCGMDAIVSVAKRRRSDVRAIILQVLGSSPFVKHVTVVDDDVDVFDSRDVAWAVATRCQPDRDTVIISGMTGSAIDPSAAVNDPTRSVTSKIGVDATRPDGDPRFDRMQVPPDARRRAAEILGA